jgi:hypothetical protein
MTVYENIKGMMKDADDIRALHEANGDKARAELWARKVEEHKAELAKYRLEGRRW